MNTPPAAPYDWELDDDLAELPPVGLVSRRRLATLENGTRPLTVHAHERCLN